MLGLLRYPLSTQEGGGAHQSPSVLLEMWAYEACRLFRDRLVGEDAQEKFDSILTSVVRSVWSVDLSARADDAMYVTWGSAPKQAGRGVGFGRSLERLSGPDMREMAGKGIVAYGEWVGHACTWCMHGTCDDMCMCM